MGLPHDEAGDFREGADRLAATGHLAPLEALEAFRALVLDFLRSRA